MFRTPERARLGNVAPLDIGGVAVGDRDARLYQIVKVGAKRCDIQRRQVGQGLGDADFVREAPFGSQVGVGQRGQAADPVPQ